MYVEDFIGRLNDSVHFFQRKTFVCGIIRTFCHDCIFRPHMGQVVAYYVHVLGNTCQETLYGSHAVIGAAKEDLHRLVLYDAFGSRITVYVVENVYVTCAVSLEVFIARQLRPIQVSHYTQDSYGD